ncbi:hypothetical protein ACP275_08G216800 [Erythranthe tilingii]
MTDQAIESPTTMHRRPTRFRTARTLALGAVLGGTQGQLALNAMNAGDGPQGQTQNSSYKVQQIEIHIGVVEVAKPIIEEVIATKLDIKLHGSSTIGVADFGCSTGHNSFPAMQIITQSIKKKLHGPGVAGDFHCRLLPECSLHFAYSSWSLHWLTGAVEVVGGGLMALVIVGVPDFWDPKTKYTIPSDVNLLGSCLMDMATMGRFSETKVDSFNLPYYFSTPKQLKSILERSDSFTIERMDILNNPGKHTLPTVKARAAFFRAVHERLLTHHFGSEIIDELFYLYMKKLESSPVFLNPCNDKSMVILAVLKRKAG